MTWRFHPQCFAVGMALSFEGFTLSFVVVTLEVIW